MVVFNNRIVFARGGMGQDIVNGSVQSKYENMGTTGQVRVISLPRNPQPQVSRADQVVIDIRQEIEIDRNYGDFVSDFAFTFC